MLQNDKAVSASEFARDWAAQHGCTGLCGAHLAPTVDHKIIITAIGSADWLEMPGSNPNQPISRAEREQIATWLTAKFSSLAKAH